LSQKDPKRPGSRDISELKARLGLKKPGAAGAGPAAAKPNGGGVVPPPGLNLPPPPGARPPGPVIPNASDDPFGAMNAMAQYGSAQRAPEIVIVNDGKPVEHVGASKRAARLAIPAAVALGTLIFGFVISGIGKDAAAANKGIDAANAMQKLLAVDGKLIGNLKSAFEGAGSLDDPKNADQLTAALNAADTDLGKNKLVALSVPEDNLGKDLRTSINQFYSLVNEIHDLILDHQATHEYEEAAIKTKQDLITHYGVKDGETLNDASKGYGTAPYKIGLYLSNPEESDSGGPAKEPQAARLVEIGAPLCGGDIATAKPATEGACKDSAPPVGFLYRFDATQSTDAATEAWNKAKVHFPGSLAPGEKFPNGELILLSDDQVIETLGKTTEGSIAAFAYKKRLSKIYDKVKQAYELSEALNGELNKRAHAGKKFTWFQ